MKERVETKQGAKTGWLLEAFAENSQRYADHQALQKLKEQQFSQFLERGFPTRREEAWKYNDLSFLEKNAYAAADASLDIQDPALEKLLKARAAESNLFVFINGHYAAFLSSHETLPQGVMIGSLEDAINQHATMIAPYLLREIDSARYPFASLNTALFSQGLFLYLPKNAVLQKSVHLLSLATQASPFMMQPRHLLILEQGSSLSFTEEYLSLGADHYLTNAVTDFFVGREAELTYYKLQNEAANAKHLSTLYFHQKQNSRVNASSFAFGSQLARNDIFVTLREHHAQCRLGGFYGTDANGQVIDHHLYVDHLAASTQSEIDFRGATAKQSKAIFNGHVKVWPEGDKTIAKQLNHNILLSPQAEIYSKPDLEIYAEEVQCRHGATVGQLDEEALFYLQARGIAREEARILLLQAFMDAILNEVRSPWLAQELKDLWSSHLRGLS